MTAVVDGNHGNHKSIHKDLPNVWFRDLRNRISPIASLDTTWLLNKPQELSLNPPEDRPNPSANHSGSLLACSSGFANGGGALWDSWASWAMWAV